MANASLKSYLKYIFFINGHIF